MRLTKGLGVLNSLFKSKEQKEDFAGYKEIPCTVEAKRVQAAVDAIEAVDVIRNAADTINARYAYLQHQVSRWMHDDDFCEADRGAIDQMVAEVMPIGEAAHQFATGGK